MKQDPPSHICSEGGSVGVSFSKNSPPTCIWSEGGSIGVSLSKNDPPTRVCSEGGSVGVVERPTDSHLERGWAMGEQELNKIISIKKTPKKI